MKVSLLFSLSGWLWTMDWWVIDSLPHFLVHLWMWKWDHRPFLYFKNKGVISLARLYLVYTGECKYILTKYFVLWWPFHYTFYHSILMIKIFYLPKLLHVKSLLYRMPLNAGYPHFLFCFVLQNRFSLCSSWCPETHAVDQAGLEDRDPPASAGIKGVYLYHWPAKNTPIFFGIRSRVIKVSDTAEVG